MNQGQTGSWLPKGTAWRFQRAGVLVIITAGARCFIWPKPVSDSVE